MNKHNFWRITLDTNPDFCNLNCVMCEDHSPYAIGVRSRKSSGSLRPIMDRGLLEKVIREAAAMGVREVIPSTMGEPLIYPHFDVFLDLCHELGLSLNLTTNGTFPTSGKHRNVEYWAERIVPLGSDVKISWNGASERTQNTLMQGTRLARHIVNAKRFIAVRDTLSEKHYCFMTMQLTFMRNNIEEIPDMLELAIELGFDRLKGHHLWAHFPEIVSQSLRNDLPSAQRWNQIIKICKERVAKHNATAGKLFRLENFFPLTLDKLEDIAPGGACPFLGRELWIDPTGRLNVCCAPDKERKTLGSFGNVTNSSLIELVEGDSYQRLTQNYLKNPLCKQCNMRRPNE